MNIAISESPQILKQDTNWEESVALEPGRIVNVHCVEDIVKVMTDTQRYPGPVRTIGSRHSTTHCGVCDGGTLLMMRGMNRIVSIDTDTWTVTAQAGALYIDVAKELEAAGLQFYVNVEIGNLSMGAAATTATKDASMPGEYGQICSYLAGVKLVLPNGNLIKVTEEKPELLQAVRSSYGLLGAVYEVSFRVKPLQAMSVHHRSYTLDEFCVELPQLLHEQNHSIMYYLFPYSNSITVEFRRYVNGEFPDSRWMWKLRNYFWKQISPATCHYVTRFVRNKKLRFWIIDNFYRLIQIMLNKVMRSRSTYAGDQLIRYPEIKGASKYTFSIWAFPEKNIVSNLRAYFAFCQEYYSEFGYRCDMVNVGYRVSKDTQSLFSYSFNENMMTLDPVCTNSEDGWDDFLQAYNRFCSKQAGIPLFNQSKWLTRGQVLAAFGPRLEIFETYRKSLDPENRLANRYFRELFGLTGPDL